MNFKFTETGNGVFLQIFDNDSEVASCHLQVSSDYAKILSGNKFKITEIPEPVWVLDIPLRDCNDAESIIMAYNVIELNGKKVKPISEPEESDLTCYIYNHARGQAVHRSWLKQKPAEPTVEEELQKKIGIINKIAEVVYRDVAFTQLLPGQIKRILAGEE